jgi:type VI secretion system protein ImpH
LPQGAGTGELVELVRFYCGDPLEFDVQVTLRGDEVPETPVGERGLLGRLSWTSWLKSGPCADKSVVFRPVAAGA